MKTQKSRSGFTLVELLVVIAIIGILATMLFGPISEALGKATQTTIRNNVGVIAKAYFTASMDGTLFDKDIDNAKAGVKASSLKNWATILAEETGTTNVDLYFGGDLQNTGAVDTVTDLDGTAALTVVEGLSSNLGSRAGATPVVWTKGARWDGTLKQWISDVGSFAAVGFADGSVMDLTDREKPFIKYGTRTTAASKMTDALPSDAKALNGSGTD